MAKGDIQALRAIVAADPDFKGSPEMYEFYVATDLAKWKKRRKLVGNGQCPVLPQAASGAALTRFWIKGPLVKGNTKIPEGTIIASGWDDMGRYRSKPHGNHAAIYLSQSAKGIKVLDQWHDKDDWVAKHGFERTLPFGGKHDVSNGGDHFHVVLTSRFTDVEFMMMKIQEAMAATAGY